MLHLNALGVEGIYNTVLCLDCDQSLTSHNVHTHFRFCEGQSLVLRTLDFLACEYMQPLLTVTRLMNTPSGWSDERLLCSQPAMVLI